MKQATLAAVMIWAALADTAAANPIVRFTVSGQSFDVELYDDQTPATVANFLRYVEDGLYVGTVIHRSVPGFIWQGGGFWLDGNPTQAVPIPTFPPVVNEPGLSNVRGTIAMAKLDGDPNSATSQWFFNLADNSANLDFQNDGFTVFGHVLGDGMNVVDAVAQLPTGNFASQLGPYGGAFTAMPYYTLQGDPAVYPLVVQGIAVVPEPSAWALAAIGAVLVAFRRRQSSPCRRATFP